MYKPYHPITLIIFILLSSILSSCNEKKVKKGTQLVKSTIEAAADLKDELEDELKDTKKQLVEIKKEFQDTKKKLQQSLNKTTTSVENAYPNNALTSIHDNELLTQKLPEDTKEIVIQHKGHLVNYNSFYHNPNYVAWCLTPERLKGKNKRKNIPWKEDPAAPSPRVTTYDFMQTGYDRGHMCPAADNKWSSKAMSESFYLTNVCPQNPNLNRGDWNEIEEWCRTKAKRYKELFIVAGPIYYKNHHKRIGEKKQIVVPDAFFKVVLCRRNKPKAIAFICKNINANNKKDKYVNTVDEVERITGIDFFPSLPDSIERRIEAHANINNW